MNNFYALWRSIFIYVFLFFSLTTFAQVGIGTTNPNGDALLELDASTTPGGLLLPRVALVATNNVAPLSAHLEGMAVYNTATTTGADGVSPGYYFNDGGRWVRIAASSDASDDWKLTGNIGTTPGTGTNQNYLGTRDNQAMIIASNNSERLRVLANGQVSVNATTPFVGDRFTVQGVTSEFAINGYSSGAAGVGVYGSSGTGRGVLGESVGLGRGVQGSNSGTGDGVYGQNSGNGNGVLGLSNNAAGMGVRAANINASGIGFMATGGNVGGLTLTGLGATIAAPSLGTASFGRNGAATGLAGVGNGSTTVHTLVSGSGLAGSGDTGVYGISTTVANGTGLIGVGNNSATILTSPDGSGVAGTGYGFGVYGMATSPGSAYGGYFGTIYGDYAYVGGWDGVQAIKINGTGSVASIVKNVNNESVKMFAPEAPETLFQDFGIGKLINGTAIIKLDPTLTKNIKVDSEHPLKVFVQLEGDCNGVFVTAKSATGFMVKELHGGSSNVDFSWSIVATRGNEKLVDRNGVTRISNNSRRFPPAPGPMVEVKTEKVETANVRDDLNQVIKNIKNPYKKSSVADPTSSSEESDTTSPAKVLNTKNKK